MRLLVLCTHNSARSQMAEGWLRYWARELGLEAEVFSAGTEATFVKPDAIAAMNEVGIDISGHTSDTLYNLPDPWNFDFVWTVCDSANESCPAYPAKTHRLHLAFPDPSGKGPEAWATARDAIGGASKRIAELLKAGIWPTDESFQTTSAKLD